MNSKSSPLPSLRRFRIIAIAEGVSFILLVFIAMPLKHLADIPEAVKYTGWLHGLLFIAYMVFLAEVVTTAKWNFSKIAMAVLASLLPFGTFVYDAKVLKKEIAGLETAGIR